MSRQTRTPFLRPVLVVAACVGLLGAGSTALHFRLDSSMPEADSQLESPDSIQLWFSQVPQADSTSIRLIDSEGEAVETSEVVQNAEDGKHQHVAVVMPLEPGEYMVAWRSMASDGHVVRGDFGFRVIAPTRD